MPGKRGPRATLSDSVKKRKKRDTNLKQNQNRVYIGDQMDRWREVKNSLAIDSNTEFAKILLDRY
jgi:hypothetical protein